MRPYLKKTHHKKRAGGVAQGEDLKFKIMIICNDPISQLGIYPKIYPNDFFFFSTRA
jgi:hypothetical protein